MNREISERLFLAETRFCENEKLLASRRWVVVVRTYPVVEVQFSADGRSTVRARAVCDDWDDVPPSVDLLDAEGTPLAKFPQGIGHSVFNNSAHPRTGRPFLCVPGIREYHEHGSHLSDKWDNYKNKKSDYDLGGILTRVWDAWMRSQ